jgi:hypothetical protein
MRRTLSITLLLSVLVLVGGGLDGTAVASASTPARSLRPPTWVEREVLWQSLSSGVAHPSLGRWLLTSPVRAARLTGATRFLRSFPGLGRVVVVVVNGHFGSPNTDGTKAKRLYLVLEARNHGCLVQGISSARHLHLGRLGHLHRYLPRQSLSSGLWGQAMIEGGPFPGGPWPLAQVKVVVWQGADAPTTQPAFTQVLSDWAGFFLLQLASGNYTLRLDTDEGGYQAPTTVAVVAGQLAAAGVYEQVP